MVALGPLSLTPCSLHVTDDELMNVDLADHEATEKNIELKRKRPGYTGYDDDEFDPENFTAGAKKKVLSKYDVDIDGEGETVRLAFLFFDSDEQLS